MNNCTPVFGRRADFCLSKHAVRLFALVPSLLLLATTLQAQVSGRVYKDFNVNGTWDSTATYLDQGHSGIKVEVFNHNGVSQGSAFTDYFGKYLIPNVSGNLRVKFTLPQYYTDGFITSTGQNSQSSIQMVAAPATGIDLGTNSADDYCGDDPSVVVPCYVVGIGNTLVPNDGLAIFKYSASGTDHSQIGMPNASLSMIGSTWGGAYQKETGTFFMASFMKRHAHFGVGGTGAIYMTNNVADPANSSTQLYLKLTDFGINTGDNPHSIPDYQADVINANGNPFDEVGKMSLGDLDISSDGKYLYVVNLKERKLHQIFIDNPHKPAGSITAADIKSWNIPSGFDELNKGIGRPFGLCVRQDKLYVGVVCDASISHDSLDLKARVYEMQPAAAVPTWQLDFEFPLNYKKGTATGERPESGKWYPWISDWYVPGQPNFMRGMPDPTIDKYVAYPMPLLSDIEMDADGSMILAFTDRFSHQIRFAGVDAHGDHHGTFGFDPRLGGDIIRAAKCDGVNWSVESNATLCGKSSDGKNNNQGIDGGEYYYGDANAALGHNELSVGSLAFRPGSREILLASTDPINSYSAGVTWLGNEKGEKKRAFQIISELDNIINNAPVNYGKASSLGDINMICGVAPLEIGNLLWRDNNGNGIQEAGETGISNVILHLMNAENHVVGKDTTDINGVYSFNHFNVVDTIGVAKPNRLGPQPNSNYTIHVKGKVGGVNLTPAAVVKKKGTLETASNLYAGPISGTGSSNRIAAVDTAINEGGWKVDDSVLGSVNAGSGPDQDLLDSDGIITGSDGVISITTQGIGSSNHSYDFAYCPLPLFDLVAQKATCNPLTDQVQNNASITLSNLQFAQKVGYSLGTTYTGPLFADATDLNNQTTFIISNLAGSATVQTYTVRVFNASDGCSRDIQVIIDGTICTPCAITASATATSIIVNNNGTVSDSSDDYFTVYVSANVISPGAAGLYEVVVNTNPDGTGGTILNVGGTPYNSPIKVGGGKTLRANGQPIKLTLRDINKAACIENVTVQADPYILECKPNICLPIAVKRN
ncbi:MAG: SdrD B-like domain-containing protein [Bacteroidota bacterium]